MKKIIWTNEIDIDEEDLIEEDLIEEDLIEEDFNQFLRPLIEEQLVNNIIIMVGAIGRWDGNFKGGKVVEIEKLLSNNYDTLRFYNNTGKLEWEGIDHDGSTIMDLYTIPKDREAQINFVKKLGIIDWLLDIYLYSEDKEENERKALEDALERLNCSDLKEIITGEDFVKITELCTPIKIK